MWVNDGAGCASKRIHATLSEDCELVREQHALVRVRASVTYDYESKRKYYNIMMGRDEVKEMLVVDKISGVVGKTSIALFMWPLMQGDDMTRLECRVRGKDRNEYKN